jgi:hypothetical protein
MQGIVLKQIHLSDPSGPPQSAIRRSNAGSFHARRGAGRAQIHEQLPAGQGLAVFCAYTLGAKEEESS